MKVGDYVRFKDKRGNTYIRKVIDGYKAHWYGCKVDKEANNVPYVSAKNIIKSSPNIIDLIEVGDYVNGYKVTMLEDEYYDDVTDSVKKIKDKEKIKIILGNEEQFYGVYAKDIKSVLTKEQFESMEYKVGE